MRKGNIVTRKRIVVVAALASFLTAILATWAIDAYGGEGNLTQGKPQLLVRMKEGVTLKLLPACGTVMTGHITLDQLSMQFQVKEIKSIEFVRWYLFAIPSHVNIREALEAYRAHPLVEHAELDYVLPQKEGQ